jgi:hypothetical protein
MNMTRQCLIDYSNKHIEKYLRQIYQLMLTINFNFQQELQIASKKNPFDLEICIHWRWQKPLLILRSCTNKMLSVRTADSVFLLTNSLVMFISKFTLSLITLSIKQISTDFAHCGTLKKILQFCLEMIN